MNAQCYFPARLTIQKQSHIISDNSYLNDEFGEEAVIMHVLKSNFYFSGERM